MSTRRMIMCRATCLALHMAILFMLIGESEMADINYADFGEIGWLNIHSPINV